MSDDLEARLARYGEMFDTEVDRRSTAGGEPKKSGRRRGRVLVAVAVAAILVAVLATQGGNERDRLNTADRSVLSTSPAVPTSRIPTLVSPGEASGRPGHADAEDSGVARPYPIPVPERVKGMIELVPDGQAASVEMSRIDYPTGAVTRVNAQLVDGTTVSIVQEDLGGADGVVMDEDSAVRAGVRTDSKGNSIYTQTARPDYARVYFMRSDGLLTTLTLVPADHAADEVVTLPTWAIDLGRTLGVWGTLADAGA